MKSAEEAAAEMVTEIRRETIIGPDEREPSWFVRISYGDITVDLEEWDDDDSIRSDMKAATALVVHFVNRFRAEGATEERERLAAHVERSAEDVAAELVSVNGWISDRDNGVALLSVVAVGGARELIARLITRERAVASVEASARITELETEVARLRADLATSDERSALWEAMTLEALEQCVDAATVNL
jgi:hypothetical protein